MPSQVPHLIVRKTEVDVCNWVLGKFLISGELMGTSVTCLVALARLFSFLCAIIARKSFLVGLNPRPKVESWNLYQNEL